MDGGYAIVWEFRIPPDSRPEFERHYGQAGTWVQLFRRAPGYEETLLLRDCTSADRYLTIDRWQSEEAYLAFRREFSEQYSRLDEECEELSMKETFLGAFEE